MLFRRQVAIAIRWCPAQTRQGLASIDRNGAVVVAVTVGLETPFLLAVHVAECK